MVASSLAGSFGLPDCNLTYRSKAFAVPICVCGSLKAKDYVSL